MFAFLTDPLPSLLFVIIDFIYVGILPACISGHRVHAPGTGAKMVVSD